MKEQVFFDAGLEGMRVWESGVIMARHYALRDAQKFNLETVVELGSGTGIAGLALIKYTRAAKVVFTDYKEEILDLIRENIELQGPTRVSHDVENVDFTDEKTWERLLHMEHIDRVVATDVVYQAILVEKLAKLIRTIKDKHPRCQIEVMMPNGRGK